MQQPLKPPGLEAETDRPETESDAEYLWRFGEVLFDEGRWELRVGNALVEIEPKPLEILGLLLRHAGEVVTKEELLAFLWPGVIVVEKALTNAVSKLRRAIGDNEQRIIVTVHRIGYRFTAPATRKQVRQKDGPRPQLQAGGAVPGRTQWRLERVLASAEGSDVWLARHEKTRECRVFKFAYSSHRLAGLKREATLSRVLAELLGPSPGIIKLHEWNFEEPPFFLECAYGGRNWLEWAEADRNLEQLSREQRLGLMLQAIHAVSAAHNVGVMHKDLKPANLLIEPDTAGGWRVQLTDFGSGRMLDPQQLDALGMTRLGQTLQALGEQQSGTLMYMPPEVLAGHLPMPSADVYALGILLYQMLVGDLRKPLATGWEHDIDDPLLRDDIAAATHGNPARRMQSALELATRLETLEQRRRQAAAEQRLARDAALLKRELELTRVRKPWIIGLVVSVIIGVVTGSIYLHRALQAEHVANAERQRAEVINGFLVSDLLAAADPLLTGKRDVTVIEAVRKSTADIDRRMAGQPRVAAIVHMTAARAYSHVGMNAEAADQYGQAAALFGSLGGPLDGEAVAAQILQVMSMVDDGRVKPATEQLHKIEAALSGARYDPEVGKLLNFVRAKLAVQAGDYPAARKFDEQALAAAQKAGDGNELPQESRELLAALRKDYAFTLEQTGDAPKAVAVMRERLAADQAALGPNHAQVLIDKLELAEAMDTESPPDAAGEALLEQILPGLDQALGPDSTYRAEALDELGFWAMNRKDWARAVTLFSQGYDLAMRLHGAGQQRTLSEAFNLGYVLERAGRYQEAQARLGETLQQAQAKLGRRAPMVQIVAYILANADLALGHLVDAREAAQGLDAASLDSVEPGNDWPARLALLRAETDFLQNPAEAPRRQLAAAVTAIGASHDDDHQELRDQGAALLAQGKWPSSPRQ
jgi:eukaryotic-like serine/threonine-protein kinase